MTSLLDWLGRRNNSDEVHGFVSPWKELNAGLWSLFLGATLLLGLRVWTKITRRFRLWYDDYILIASWLVLLANNILIVWQFGNGYVLKDSSEKWNDQMRILINISSCGTLIGQTWTKTAFGVTLLRIVKSSRWQQCVIWYCIGSMNLFMFIKVLFQWARICDKTAYQQSWRVNFCLSWNFRDRLKEGGNIYNIIMDFVFAIFPWVITRHLNMRRGEKIGLCVTMSLGLIVAIVAAIRVSWKENGNKPDEYYFFRNGLSQIWYSSEITGTIMVQCIPILRPLLRELTTNANSVEDFQNLSWLGRFSNKHASFALPDDTIGENGAGNERFALKKVPEGGFLDENFRRPEPSVTEQSGIRSGYSRKRHDLELFPSFVSYETNVENQKGVWPTPARFP